MWLIAKDGFLSIVEWRNNPAYLMVRARVKGDIEHYFPDARVIRTDDRDYLYRTLIPRTEVADRLCDTVMDIDYDNFKSAVTDHRRSRWYVMIWSVLEEMQDKLKNRLGGINDKHETASKRSLRSIAGGVCNPTANLHTS